VRGGEGVMCNARGNGLICGGATVVLFAVGSALSGLSRYTVLSRKLRVGDAC